MTTQVLYGHRCGVDIHRHPPVLHTQRHTQHYMKGFDCVAIFRRKSEHQMNAVMYQPAVVTVSLWLQLPTGMMDDESRVTIVSCGTDVTLPSSCK